MGVVDAGNQFARDLRLALWQEHLDLESPDDILDLSSGLDCWQDKATRESGRVRIYPTEPGSTPALHSVVLPGFIDPYGGPM
jgi:hypothetical protein